MSNTTKKILARFKNLVTTGDKAIKIKCVRSIVHDTITDIDFTLIDRFHDNVKEVVMPMYSKNDQKGTVNLVEYMYLNLPTKESSWKDRYKELTISTALRADTANRESAEDTLGLSLREQLAVDEGYIEVYNKEIETDKKSIEKKKREIRELEVGIATKLVDIEELEKDNKEKEEKYEIGMVELKETSINNQWIIKTSTFLEAVESRGLYLVYYENIVTSKGRDTTAILAEVPLKDINVDATPEWYKENLGIGNFSRLLDMFSIIKIADKKHSLIKDIPKLQFDYKTLSNEGILCKEFALDKEEFDESKVKLVIGKWY